MEFTRIPTPQGDINAVRRGTSPNTILFIHVNSGSWRMFKHLLASDSLASRYTLIAFDLPGHGDSADAPADQQAGQEVYTFAGYARAAVAVLRHYAAASVVIYGCSLGGHIAVDAAMQLAETSNNEVIKVRGIMTSGSPLCHNRAEAIEGFNLDPDDNVAAAESLTEDQVQVMVRKGFGGEEEPWMREAALRTDARARPTMFKSIMRGDGRDHRKFVRETTAFPLAVVNGAEDVFMKVDVFEKIHVGHGNLWRGRIIRIEGSGHSPCWDQPAVFVPLFEEFVDESFSGV
ncbi:hypothetical protein VPNG_05057 [Cytospora leucostoma]|uniref:AB hydrolase-1 domain-containing protein n=1 Tax=Cytospora leucostoma TaxID=1230097 RepID=A0A423X424_9PEZI|nr:hypothetical protein VPNG_05057 [Cytospora leucostoma]